LFFAPLDGKGAPDFGRLEHEENVEPAPERNGNTGGAVFFNGVDAGLRYELPFFPERDYTFYAWVYPESLPVGSIQQIFSGWCQGMDDPLRVTLRDNGVCAGIDSGSGLRNAGCTLDQCDMGACGGVQGGACLAVVC